MPTEDVVLFLRAQISEFQGKLSEASAEARKFEGEGTSAFGRFQQFSTGALLAVGAAAVAVGAYGIKMADDYEAAHARLETAVRNTGGDFDELKGRVGAVDRQLEGLGFTNADTESSLAALTGATHNSQQALGLMGLAADIARGRHIDLSSATDLLVKVETGHVALLGRLGINVKDVTGKTIDQQTAIQRLTDLYGGQASAYADTFAGKMQVLRTRGEDLAKNIGLAVIPVVEDLASAGAGALSWLQNMNRASDGWIGKGALVAGAAVLTVGAFAKLAPAVMSASSAVTDFVETARIWAMLNPELATGIGVAAAGAGLFVGALIALSNQESQTARVTKDLTRAVEDQGQTLGQATASELQKFIDKHQEIRDTMDRTGVSASQLYAAITGDGTAYDQVRGAVEAYATSQAHLHGQQVNTARDAETFLNDLKAQRNGYADAKTKIDAHNVSAKQLQAVTKDSTAAIDANTAATNNATDAEKAQQAAMQALDDQLKRLNDDTLAAANADISLQRATLDVGNAQDDYTRKLLVAAAAHGRDAAASRDAAAAGLALRSSILSAVSAAEADAKAHVDLTSKATGTALAIEEENAKHKAAAGELATLEKTYPTLTGLIEQYRAQLGLIPQTVATGVHLTISAAVAAGTAQVNAGVAKLIGPHAAGGVIGPGELGTVGEAGPELAEGLPGGGVRIYSNAQSRAMVGGGPRTIIVNPTVHASEYETGQSIMSKLITEARDGGPVGELVNALGL